MTRWPRGRRSLRLLIALVAVAPPAVAQGPAATPPRASPGAAMPAPHPADELDCRQCHVGSHQGVVRMYRGEGGHGAPAIPSHMFQLRVECVACHAAPKEGVGAAVVGQTFRPTEQACVGCHGEKYRGMMPRWITMLQKMRDLLGPKLADVRGALGGADPKNPKHARARQLADQAEANVRFVALGRGVHNVFYAGDLLKVANAWLDEAAFLLERPRAPVDDTLVRGGYCAVLCHEQAGVKLKETVTFGKQKIPHGRHVTELGAVCTACHSAELHKQVTATAATCSGCHHAPQNDRCEGCHRAQAAFYRGKTETGLVPVEPNPMVDAVPCVACHDFTLKHSRQAVARKCTGCHEPPYLALLEEWTAGFDKDAVEATRSLRRAETVLQAARRAGRAGADAEALVRDARQALALVRQARGVHNPGAADLLLALTRQKADEAIARLTR